LREAQLARAYAQLRVLAGASDLDVRLDIAEGVAGARFPPGVLLPLIDQALWVSAGSCQLVAARSAGDCTLLVTLPAQPLDAVVTRVRLLLADVYGAAAQLSVDHAKGVVNATIKVPYELA